MKWIGRSRGSMARRNPGRSMDMAHRRSLVAGRVVAGLIGGSVITLILAGVVFLSNEVTALRAEIELLLNLSKGE